MNSTKQPCVYIISNKYLGVIYIGVTSNLKQRIYSHKQGAVEGFSQKYQLHKLVWYECHQDMYSAISREKQLKRWCRDWKLELICTFNPSWRDLYDDI